MDVESYQPNPGAVPSDRGHALVIGGFGGLGTATVRVLLEAGHKVVVAERRAGEESELDEIGRDHPEGSLSFELLDVADESSVHDLADRLRGQGIHIAYIVAMQATVALGDPWEIEARNWRTVIRVNLDGCFYLVQAFLPAMIERQFGRVVNFSSVYAYDPPPEQIAYSAAKGGVTAFAKSLAVSAGPYGITSNAICPGLIWHKRLSAVMDDEGKAAMVARTPAGRPGHPDEIAHLVKYVCSEEAGYMNGQALHLNGGLYLPG
jgi:NAD(P)-dependent dehydrogenase (short-subunit alcohol dehydrogenase family)